MAIFTSQPTWLAHLQDSYQEDPVARQLLSELSITPEQGQFSLVQGVIKYKGRIWLGHSPVLQHQVMHALHSSAIGGHSGAFVTMIRIRKLFYWPHMKKNVQEFVAGCAVCQQAKTEKVPYPGLLKPLEVPDHAWQVVTMDFIEGLPSSTSYNCILVVVDKFSKYSHFIKLSHPFSALKVAKLYMEHVYKLHGMPQAIVSDRDKIFTSHFWKALFKLMGTKLMFISAYHPQTDGKTERVN